jgi:hypothetical protein
LLVDVVENPGHGGRVPRVNLQKSKGSTIVSEQNMAVVFAVRHGAGQWRGPPSGGKPKMEKRIRSEEQNG